MTLTLGRAMTVAARTSRDGDSPWVLVEIDGESHTIVAEGCRPKNRTGTSRTRIANTAASARTLAAIVRDCGGSGRDVATTVYPPGGKARMHLRAIPVIGPGGIVHGVHLWGGPDGASPSARPSVGAFTWHGQDAKLTTAPDFERLILGCSTPPDADRKRGLPELFRMVTRFADEPGFLALLSAASAARATWSGTVAIEGEDGVVRQVLLHARAVPTTQGRVVRALAQDVTGGSETVSDSLELATLRQVVDRLGIVIGRCDLRTSMVYDWLARPKGDLARWLAEVPEVDSAHVHEVAEAGSRLLSGTAAEVTTETRIRFIGGPWIDTTLRWRSVLADSPYGTVEVCRSTTMAERELHWSGERTACA